MDMTDDMQFRGQKAGIEMYRMRTDDEGGRRGCEDAFDEKGASDDA